MRRSQRTLRTASAFPAQALNPTPNGIETPALGLNCFLPSSTSTSHRSGSKVVGSSQMPLPPSPFFREDSERTLSFARIAGRFFCVRLLHATPFIKKTFVPAGISYPKIVTGSKAIGANEHTLTWNRGEARTLFTGSWCDSAAPQDLVDNSLQIRRPLRRRNISEREGSFIRRIIQRRHKFASEGALHVRCFGEELGAIQERVRTLAHQRGTLSNIPPLERLRGCVVSLYCCQP